MSVVTDGLKILKEDGIKSFLREGTYFGIENWMRMNSNSDRGTNIYDRKWDVLVILDATRLDALQVVADEYDFIEEIGTFESLGSSSEEWMEKNFVEERSVEMENTAYITGNPFTEELIDETQFEFVDEVWKHGWNRSKGTIEPRPLTNSAIEYARANNPDRMIIHYMQPHYPFLSAPELGRPLDVKNWGEVKIDSDVWEELRDGEASYYEVWNNYIENLRIVLEDLEILLENIDAETVAISADHGNAFGERGIFGHPTGVSLDVLREVPWVQTTGTDKHTHDPEVNREDVDEDVEQRLNNLGYT